MRPFGSQAAAPLHLVVPLPIRPLTPDISRRRWRPQNDDSVNAADSDATALLERAPGPEKVRL